MSARMVSFERSLEAPPAVLPSNTKRENRVRNDVSELLAELDHLIGIGWLVPGLGSVDSLDSHAVDEANV